MTGCLTINVDGAYSYYRRGKKEEFPPDLKLDSGEGRISFREGILTNGKPSDLVGWKGDSLGEEGVDILIDLKKSYFIDRVILTQEITRCMDREEARSISSSAVSEVSVYTKRGKEGFQFSGWTRERIPNEPILDEELSIELGLEADNILVHLASFRKDILIKELDIWGSDPEPHIFPVPQEIIDESGNFEVKKLTRVVCGKGASEDTHFSAELFIEKMEEDGHGRLDITEETDNLSRALVLGRPGECGFLDKQELDGNLKEDGYVLKITGNGIFLTAPDKRGLLYGIETLLQLIRAGDTLPNLTIKDYPRAKIRGVHLFMPAREDIPFYKRLIRYVLAPMKMNTVFLQVTSGMEFDRRPEINRAWEKANHKVKQGKAPYLDHGEICRGGYLAKEEVRDLVNHTREYGMEVIPEIQSLSHVQYLTLTYPDIAEDKEEEYPHCYCPSNPESYKIVFDMIDEIAEVFKPAYISMGHDEVYALGQCPECRKKSQEELFTGDVIRIYDYLKKKGLKMMIWGDMLQPFRWYSTPKAEIPKDIILLDFVWYFRTDEDIEDRLLAKGFKVIMGNLYSSHYTRFNTRIAKKGMIGGEVSTWTVTGEYELGKKGKIYDFIYTANMLWSGHYCENLRWSYTRQISGIMPFIREKLSGSEFPSLKKKGKFVPVNLKSVFNAALVDESGSGGGFNFLTLPAGKVSLRGIEFSTGGGLIVVESENMREKNYPSEIEIPVARKMDSLIFLHSTAPNAGFSPAFSGYAGSREAAGLYRIIYEDGTTEETAIDQSWNIGEWSRRYGEAARSISRRHDGYFSPYRADPFWEGKTPDGRNITLYGYEWINPHPGRGIKAVRLKAEGDSAVILSAITGVCL
jgi:hypothetical protein